MEVEKHWELCWVLNGKVHARQQVFNLKEAERLFQSKLNERSVYKFQLLEVTKSIVKES